MSNMFRIIQRMDDFINLWFYIGENSPLNLDDVSGLCGPQIIHFEGSAYLLMLHNFSVDTNVAV